MAVAKLTSSVFLSGFLTDTLQTPISSAELRLTIASLNSMLAAKHMLSGKHCQGLLAFAASGGLRFYQYSNGKEERE